MSAGFPYFCPTESPEVESLRRSWGWFLAWGILLILCGLAALSHPVLTTILATQIFGVLLLIAGVAELVIAFTARSWGGLLTTLLCGFLYLFAGVLFLDRPELAATGYTLFLTMLFFAAGVVRIAAALTHRFPGWFWMVLNGVINIALALLIWRDLPEAALWVIGLFVGIDLLFAGWTWVILSLGLRQLTSSLPMSNG